ncbi:HAD-IA family hydrolase [Sphingobium sp. H33]|uniref:HAD-IA family hydrolase n=1 Tax=Sphingobium nicotianae TaxID=2782607 RepID=A0A9X1DF53_9SPHN|nr:HAD-IA family hydrolase [Sphingobium nicotianae]
MDVPISRGQIARQFLSAAKGVLLDWDGCVAIENRVLCSAKKLIEQHAGRIAIVSNNSTHVSADLAAVLARHGLDVPEHRILLAGVEAIRHVSARGARRVMMIGSPKVRQFARMQGIVLVRENADLVVLARDARFTYAKLERAANALQRGADLVVANVDRTHPGIGNRLVPETGSLLEALLACVDGVRDKMRVIGKPAPLLFELACERLSVTPGEAVMIGDNPETDGEGARRAGIHAILVGGASPLRLEHLIEPSV